MPLTPTVAADGHDFQDAADYRRRFPDGRTASNPALAREEHGARIHDPALTDLPDLPDAYRRFLAD